MDEEQVLRSFIKEANLKKGKEGLALGLLRTRKSPWKPEKFRTPKALAEMDHY